MYFIKEAVTKKKHNSPFRYHLIAILLFLLCIQSPAQIHCEKALPICPTQTIYVPWRVSCCCCSVPRSAVFFSSNSSFPFSARNIEISPKFHVLNILQKIGTYVKIYNNLNHEDGAWSRSKWKIFKLGLQNFAKFSKIKSILGVFERNPVFFFK